MISHDSFLDKLRAIVLDNYTDEQFGVSELVSEYGLSRSQLHRKLKAATGQSISQFIREIRLDEAAKLLREQDVTASEVAYQVGFNSATYFNTCFNEYFGYPPGEAKHHETSIPLSKNVSATRTRKNKWVLVWLIALTVITGSYFAYSYFQKDKETAITDSEKPKTIAVLPFKNWSGDPELEYVSDGMTDAVIRRLTVISDIDKVVPYTTIINYKDSEKSIVDIANELNVEYILEGNFKLAGKQVMSNLDLIEVESNNYLWSLEYTGIWSTDDLFSMQAEVAENVAKNMAAEVTIYEINQINFKPTDNEEAYRLFLEGYNQYNKFSQYGLENALIFFDKAIKLDSTYVHAYIGMARTYMLSGAFWGVLPEKEAWHKAKPYLDKALKLDAEQNGYFADVIESDLAHNSFLFELDLSKFEKRVKRLSEENKPLRGADFDYLRKTGRFDTALKTIESEIEVNPGEAFLFLASITIYCMNGNKSKAIQSLSTYDPVYQDNYFYLIETSKWYYHLGEMSKSKKHLEAILQQFKDRPPLIYWLSAVHAEIEGDQKGILSSLNELIQKYNANESGSPAWFIGLYYCHIQDYDTAFEWLNKSYERKEVELTWFKEEPLLKPLKKDPRYIELYNKIGFDVIEPLSPAD